MTKVDIATLNMPAIVRKLNYALTESQKLGQDILNSHEKENEVPPDIDLIAENILSHIRECFDHMAIDLAEHLVLPYVPTNIQEKYRNKKIKCYFPFFKGQILNRKDNVFHYAKDANIQVHLALLSLAKSIENKRTLPNTLLELKALEDLVFMVNEKKHAKILKYERQENEKIFIGDTENSFVFDKDFTNEGPIKVALPLNGKPRRVPAYRFAYNNKDIESFCPSLVRTAQIIVDDLYKQLFNIEANAFKPEPSPQISIVSEAEIRDEQLEKRSAPIKFDN